MASCLSSDTDSGGDSKPTATQCKRVSGTRPLLSRPPRIRAVWFNLQTFQKGQSYGTTRNSRLLGERRGWGWATKELEVVCGTCSTKITEQDMGKMSPWSVHDFPWHEVRECSPSRVDCRGPILPIRRNLHTCLAAGTYSWVTWGISSLAQCCPS